MLALKNIITSCLRTGLLFGMLGMAFMPDVIAPPHSGGAIVSTSVPQERVFGHETLHVVGAPLAPIPAESQIRAALSNLRAVKPLPPALIDSETLWLARLVYSESKRIEEQELVAWVARNRAETGYRGKRTYERIALDPFQFSAFNAGSATHGYYSSLDARAKAAGWQKALALAYYVRYAGEDLRRFPGRQGISIVSNPLRRLGKDQNGQTEWSPLRRGAPSMWSRDALDSMPTCRS